MFATRARRNVENARLMLDAAKAKGKAGLFKAPGGGEGEHEGEPSEEVKLEIEQAEDEFVGQTEEAVGVMKNVSASSSYSVLFADCPGPRHAGAAAQPCRAHRGAAGVPQEVG